MPPKTAFSQFVADQQRRMTENERRRKEQQAEADRKRKEILAKYLTPKAPPKPAPAAADPLAAIMAMPGAKEAVLVYQLCEMLGQASRPTPAPKAPAVAPPQPV